MKKNHKKLMILGAGPFAEEIADIAKESGYTGIFCFVEGIDPKLCNQELSGAPIKWVDDLKNIPNNTVAVCAVGSTKREGFIKQVADQGVNFATIIHPGAKISETSSIERGGLVLPGCIIAAHTIIGRHVIINRGCLIGHHTRIGNVVTISPGANIAGRVTIGNNCYIGMGAIVIDGVTIGDNSVIGAGAVVTKDVPDRVLSVGIPARVVKELDG